ncbi:transcriptional regulator, ArgP, LysR family [Ferrimonas balearica DSM 9799]|uniref:Transcriptional regulator, ArgP, LysR family n=1 Tax=Ferrimonas balearica (strain DSM 9799 / CCM 4581 / KCTC 23876 / PAT) TaxID=550540 RepID=E1SQA1_FERBD|nr:LysR family transcriptional regulator ArgP [Ferrimonas balearica]ADN77872.1 transcriptional regulator, ArgP, LysR family [Ferrimonas balearica DSM 9799]MBW3141431.1 LysR family transcriptional regulator ArgP [Ferrimonas balearica]MBY6108475.1 LysR family transcriptional regulator ArgP [Ferrimonas balearica]
MLDYKQLHALAEVVRQGSFDKAARKLNLTQSAVSQRVSTLEQRVGRPLLVRANPVRATEAGLLLLRHQQQVALMEANLSEALLTGERSEFERVALAVNADSLATWLPQALSRLFNQHQLLTELIVEDEDITLNRLKSGEVAGCISAIAKPVQGCRTQPLGTLRYRMAASPAFIERYFAGGVDAASLAHAPTVVYSQHDDLMSRFLARHYPTLGHLPPHHQVPSAQAFVNLALQGITWALIPELQLAPLQATGALQSPSPHHLDVPLYWHSWRLESPTMTRIAAVLKQQARSQLLNA